MDPLPGRAPSEPPMTSVDLGKLTLNSESTSTTADTQDVTYKNFTVTGVPQAFAENIKTTLETFHQSVDSCDETLHVSTKFEAYYIDAPPALTGKIGDLLKLAEQAKQIAEQEEQIAEKDEQLAELKEADEIQKAIVHAISLVKQHAADKSQTSAGNSNASPHANVSTHTQLTLTSMRKATKQDDNLFGRLQELYQHAQHGGSETTDSHYGVSMWAYDALMVMDDGKWCMYVENLLHFGTAKKEKPVASSASPPSSSTSSSSRKTPPSTPNKAAHDVDDSCQGTPAKQMAQSGATYSGHAALARLPDITLSKKDGHDNVRFASRQQCGVLLSIEVKKECSGQTCPTEARREVIRDAAMVRGDRMHEGYGGTFYAIVSDCLRFFFMKIEKNGKWTEERVELNEARQVAPLRKKMHQFMADADTARGENVEPRVVSFPGGSILDSLHRVSGSVRSVALLCHADKLEILGGEQRSVLRGSLFVLRVTHCSEDEATWVKRNKNEKSWRDTWRKRVAQQTHPNTTQFRKHIAREVRVQTTLGQTLDSLSLSSFADILCTEYGGYSLKEARMSRLDPLALATVVLWQVGTALHYLHHSCEKTERQPIRGEEDGVSPSKIRQEIRGDVASWAGESLTDVHPGNIVLQARNGSKMAQWTRDGAGSDADTTASSTSSTPVGKNAAVDDDDDEGQGDKVIPWDIVKRIHNEFQVKCIDFEGVGALTKFNLDDTFNYPAYCMKENVERLMNTFFGADEQSRVEGSEKAKGAMWDVAALLQICQELALRDIMTSTGENERREGVTFEEKLVGLLLTGRIEAAVRFFHKKAMKQLVAKNQLRQKVQNDIAKKWQDTRANANG